MDKALKDKIFAEVDNSTIPEELKVVYLTANALQLMVQDSFNRIAGVFRKNGYRTPENRLLSGLNDYCKMVKSATWQFFHSIEPQISGATFEAIYDRERPETAEHAAEVYDHFGESSNEICRLLLLYIDRTAKSDNAFRTIFKTLRRLPSGNIFNDNDYSRFKQI